MISSLHKLQDNANKLLTEIVENERAGQNLMNSVTAVNSVEDEEMEDEGRRCDAQHFCSGIFFFQTFLFDVL
jgi:hypothetical protein